MNQTSHFIFGIYHFNLMIRDTLEYTLERKEYNIQAYEQRRKNMLAMLDNPSPLRQFLDQNKETGEKIDAQLREFIEDIYGEKSTIVHRSGDELRVDKAQHIAVYNYIVGLHETLSDITRGYINFAKKQNMAEDSFIALVDDDERLYRCIAYMAIFDDVEKTFIEFNQAMHETKGQPSPQSNFIVNDLKRYIGFIKFVQAHNTIQDEKLKKMMDDTEMMFSYMEGKEKLPEDKKFPQLFQENKNYIRSLVAEYEQKWKVRFESVYRALVEFERSRMNAAAKNDTQA